MVILSLKTNKSNKIQRTSNKKKGDQDKASTQQKRKEESFPNTWGALCLYLQQLFCASKHPHTQGSFSSSNPKFLATCRAHLKESDSAITVSAIQVSAIQFSAITVSAIQVSAIQFSAITVSAITFFCNNSFCNTSFCYNSFSNTSFCNNSFSNNIFLQ